ncbi:MAG: ABC transporter permease, partial [Acetobacteraceae bacterium]|nr:ABC transporter permease [Acetobacteraceae bacterium]
MSDATTQAASAGAAMTEEAIGSASQARLIWWRFRKHRLAVVSLAIVALFYLVAALADFMATTDPHASDARRSYVSPSSIHWFDTDGSFRPHIYGLRQQRDMQTFRLVYRPDPERKLPLVLFAKGFEHRVFGLFTTNRHLVGVEGARGSEGLFLLGTDVQGRDLWSRLMVATRVSLTIGLIGVSISLFLGVLLGGISAIYGGIVDLLIQRLIEVIRSLPTIPLWMGLAAALPTTWSVTEIYFAITLLIAFLAWTDLARVVRGKFLSLKTEDFVLAAELAGAGQLRIIFKHML